MKTARSISIAFSNAIAQAKKLERSAEQMENCRKQLEDIRHSLRMGWEGESADAYYEKCMVMENKLQKTSSDLMQIASVIRKSAKTYRDAELKALDAIATKSK